MTSTSDKTSSTRRTSSSSSKAKQRWNHIHDGIEDDRLLMELTPKKPDPWKSVLDAIQGGFCKPPSSSRSRIRSNSNRGLTASDDSSLHYLEEDTSSSAVSYTNNIEDEETAELSHSESEHEGESVVPPSTSWTTRPRVEASQDPPSLSLSSQHMITPVEIGRSVVVVKEEESENVETSKPSVLPKSRDIFQKKKETFSKISKSALFVFFVCVIIAIIALVNIPFFSSISTVPLRSIVLTEESNNTTAMPMESLKTLESPSIEEEDVDVKQQTPTEIETPTIAIDESAVSDDVVESPKEVTELKEEEKSPQMEQEETIEEEETLAADSFGEVALEEEPLEESSIVVELLEPIMDQEDDTVVADEYLEDTTTQEEPSVVDDVEIIKPEEESLLVYDDSELLTTTQDESPPFASEHSLQEDPSVHSEETVQVESMAESEIEPEEVTAEFTEQDEIHEEESLDEDETIIIVEETAQGESMAESEIEPEEITTEFTEQDEIHEEESLDEDETIIIAEETAQGESMAESEIEPEKITATESDEIHEEETLDEDDTLVEEILDEDETISINVPPHTIKSFSQFVQDNKEDDTLFDFDTTEPEKQWQVMLGRATQQQHKLLQASLEKVVKPTLHILRQKTKRVVVELQTLLQKKVQPTWNNLHTKSVRPLLQKLKPFAKKVGTFMKPVLEPLMVKLRVQREKL